MSTANASASAQPQEFEADRLDRLAPRLHPGCIACGHSSRAGLGLRFEPSANGSVRGVFGGDLTWQGYPGWLHGGVIAMLLDAAMTHCLFAQRVEAVTARLEIRYLRPVRAAAPSQLFARVSEDNSPLFRLHAELEQDGQVRASAEALFMRTEVPPAPEQR